MLEAAVPSPNTLAVVEPMVLLKDALEPKDAVPPNAGELPKDGGLPKTGALPKPPVEGKIDKCLTSNKVLSTVHTMITKKGRSRCWFCGFFEYSY